MKPKRRHYYNKKMILAQIPTDRIALSLNPINL